jgi:hypothetical protein
MPQTPVVRFGGDDPPKPRLVTGPLGRLALLAAQRHGLFFGACPIEIFGQAVVAGYPMFALAIYGIAVRRSRQ